MPARDSICFVRDAATYCVSPDDTRIVSVPQVAENPLDGAHWELGADGHVRVVPSVPVHGEENESGQTKAARREDKQRGDVAKGLPPLTKLVQTARDGCGLAANGEAICWSEPLQIAEPTEHPVIGAPIHVRPTVHGTDLFLQEWSNLCVLADDGRVLCSPPVPPTSECFVRGGAPRCGADAQHLYDPRTLLTRLLAVVPDIQGARAIAPYATLTFWDHNFTPQQVPYVSITNMRDGGCALDADGVSCFERDPCPKSKPWRTQRIAGLPKDLATLALADDDGYALDRAGNLYTWPRMATECNAATPAARVFLGDVHEVSARECIIANEPSFAALTCAAMNDGTMRCWRSPKDVPVTLPQ